MVKNGVDFGFVRGSDEDRWKMVSEKRAENWKQKV